MYKNIKLSQLKGISIFILIKKEPTTVDSFLDLF